VICNFVVFIFGRLPLLQYPIEEANRKDFLQCWFMITSTSIIIAG